METIWNERRMFFVQGIVTLAVQYQYSVGYGKEDGKREWRCAALCQFKLHSRISHRLDRRARSPPPSRA
jgi:hypothetical protein